jgi:hypothetical protein
MIAGEDGQAGVSSNLDLAQVVEATQQEDELAGDHLTLEAASVSISIGPAPGEETAAEPDGQDGGRR